MTDHELLHAIFREVKEQRQEMKEIRTIVDEHTNILYEHSKTLNKHSQILDSHSLILSEHSNKLDDHTHSLTRLEKKLDAQTDIVNSFKIHIDYLVQKQAKQDMELNRINKLIKL
ncbi:hypothetical protein ACQCT5_01385 [Sutcliffiella halmapala]